MNIIQKLTSHARVATVDDERQCGNGVIVTLKTGWSWDALSDNRVKGAETLTAALMMVRNESIKFNGPYTT